MFLRFLVSCSNCCTEENYEQPLIDVLQNNCFLRKTYNIHRKTFVLKYRSATILKKRLQHSCFPVNTAKFLNKTFFYRTPLMAASAKTFNRLHVVGISMNTGCKLSLHKTFIRCPGSLLNVLYTSGSSMSLEGLQGNQWHEMG